MKNISNITFNSSSSNIIISRYSAVSSLESKSVESAVVINSKRRQFLKELQEV